MLAHWQIRSALLALFVLTYASAADDANRTLGQPTFRSTVTEVRVPFFATDENNQSVPILKQSDFAVVDGDRVVRTFRSFTHSDETALDVVALVDLSQSVAPRYRVAMNDVLQLVAREQSVPDDNISVLSFGGTVGTAPASLSSGLHPAILCERGCGTPESVSRLQEVKSNGTTPLFDALIFGADFIVHRRRAGTRPVVILFSDGNDTISLHTRRDALLALRDAGALVYTVDMGSSKNQTLYQIAGSAFLQQISDTTGGRYFSPRLSQQDGAAAVLNAVLEDLRASYVVAYELPSHQAGFHALRVMPTHNLNLTFHSRNGYYYDPSPR